MSDPQAEHALDTVRTVAALRRRVAAWRGGGKTVALVPTMGALHAGHGALIEAARQDCNRVIASLFVNPAQFGPGEDFASYPRDEDADAAFLKAAGVDLLYAPAAAEMYPEGFATTVSVAGLTEMLCGPHRAGHFAGVATVVAKLFIQAVPDKAYFGEKDYQQLCVIRRMAADLDLDVAIEAVPTVREADGLAVSSRNAYLNAEERAVAPRLYATLTQAAERIAAGAGIDGTCAEAREALLAAGFSNVDYVTCANAETLAPAGVPGRPLRVFAAARLGRARLIDNVPVPA